MKPILAHPPRSTHRLRRGTPVAATPVGTMQIGADPVTFIPSDRLPPMPREKTGTPGDVRVEVSRLQLAGCVAIFASFGAVVALSGFVLFGGPAWFAAIPAFAAAGWYVGAHPYLVATLWAASSGAGPIL